MSKTTWTPNIDTKRHSRSRSPGKVDSRVREGLLGVVSDMSVWFKADALGLADTDLVYVWYDSSENRNDAVQGIAAAAPTFRINQLNGYPTIYFNGLFYLQHTRVTPSTGSTYFIVWQRDAAANNDIVLAQAATVYTYLQYASVWHTASGISSTVAMAAGAYKLKCCVYNGTNHTRYTNGTQDDQLVSAFKGDYQYIGPVASGSLKGYVAEVVVFNKALSTGERQTWEAYFQTKYALW